MEEQKNAVVPENNIVVEQTPVIEEFIEEKPVENPAEISVEPPVLEGKYLAGNTPEEAWQNLLQVRKDNEKAANLDIYTHMTRFIFKNNQEDLPDYTEETYKIRQKGDYAVLSFEKLESPPVLFCKTEEGWQFDGVHQRKIIRKNTSAWEVEKYISPYSALLRKMPVSFRIDIPLKEEDIYRISKDKKLTEQITELEDLYKSGKMNYDKALVLGRLYSINTLGLKAIPILEEVREKKPENSDVYKYLAIAYLDSAYDYKSALEHIQKYVEILPENEFGHNFLGYLNLQKENYTEAEAEFKKALEVNSKSCYAYAKLSRIYKKAGDTQGFEKMFKKTQETCTGDNYERFIWLIQWLHNGNK